MEHGRPLASHSDIPIALHVMRLPHLQLELLARIFLTYRRYRTDDAGPRGLATDHQRPAAATAAAADAAAGLSSGGSDRVVARLGLALETGLGSCCHGFDFLEGDSLGDHVF